MFTLRDGLVLFSSDLPASHATMFAPGGEALTFRADQSAGWAGTGGVAHPTLKYTWAFEQRAQFANGQYLVFAAHDREVVAELVMVMDAQGTRHVAKISNAKVTVTRGEGGKPLSISGVRPAALPKPEKLVTLARHLPGQAPPKEMRVLMINPSVPYNQWGCGGKVGAMNEASFSAHGMAYVSATLKNAGHEVWLVDLRTCTGWQHTSDMLAAQEFDVAFMGFLSIDCFNATAVCRLMKELHPNKPLVVGGLHVSIAKEHVFPREDLIEEYLFGNENNLPDVFKDFLRWKGEGKYEPRHFPQADYVILDDGEIAARDLVAELAAGRTPASRTIDGGAVPMEVARHMDRDLFDLNVEAYSPILPFQPTPMATVTWARGCPFHCTYCNLSSQLSNTNVRTKPIEMIVEEIDDLHRRLGRLGSLMIHDDLTFHHKAIERWCEAILSKYPEGVPIWLQTRSNLVIKWCRKDRPFWELLCRAGLVYTSVGFESGSQRVLDYMKKDCTVEENIECGEILNEYGINSFANFLWGMPTETNEEAEETVALVQQIKPGFLSGSIYCSYPGTAQDKAARAEGLIVQGEVYTRSHLPWQFTIKGIDYAHRNDCVRRAGQYANYLRMPKLLHPDRQADLAASSRGLAIH